MRELAAALTEPERNRLVVAEIGIDEILSMLDRYNVPDTNRHYRALAEISGVISEAMLLADGPEKREARLRSTRDRLTAAFPLALNS